MARARAGAATRRRAPGVARSCSSGSPSFWLPDQPVLHIGSTPGSVAGRVAAIAKTVPGDAKPAASGLWLHFLRNLGRPAGLVGGDRRARGVRGRAARGVRGRDHRRRPRGRRPRARPARPPASCRGPCCGHRRAIAQGDGHHEPAAPRGQGARAAAGDADRPVPAGRGGRRAGTRPSAPAARRPAAAPGGSRRRPAYAAQGSPRKPPPEPVLVSAEGLERLQAELAGLLAERPGVIKRIATAREHGDLKENAEYHAAREEQGFLEGRIKALEAKLKVAQVVAPTERGARVELGSRVKLDEDGEETVELQVVGSAEANSREGRISSVSPVGAALMGRRVGDAVTIVTPGGEIHYRVLEID